MSYGTSGSDRIFRGVLPRDARGNRRERIFRNEADRLLFYQTLGEACERTGWRVHAWVLMSNHYHLMVETPEANLVAGMQWLQNTYTRRHNCRHRLWDGCSAIVSGGQVVGQRTRFVARFRRAQGRLGKFDLGDDASAAELDCRQTSDAQRCERESTGSPIPYTQTETGDHVQGMS